MYEIGAQRKIPDVISFAASRAGSDVALSCVSNAAFMAKGNWSAELAARIFDAMLHHAITEGRVAMLEDCRKS